MFELLMFTPEVVLPAAPVGERESDVDVSLIEDLDFPARCGARHAGVVAMFGVLILKKPMEPPCQKPAEWVLTCKGCGYLLLCCGPHLALVMQIDSVRCGLCHTIGRGTDVYRFSLLES